MWRSDGGCGGVEECRRGCGDMREGCGVEE